jgi:alpha-L-arabinofuranosidase
VDGFKGSFLIKPGLIMRCCRSLTSAICVSRVSPIDCSFFCRRFVLPLRVVVRRAPLAMCPLFVSFALIGMGLAAPAIVAQKVELSVDVSNVGAKIDRNIFGQLAEHLGHGVYEGIWVGPDSTIPNTRGIRNDVVAALKAIRVPNVRWPGGCFADEYHWRDGIGSPRTVTLNPNWGGVIEPNSFGTHEFMDFLEQIGAEAYVSVNVGSGTPREAAEWLEYLTAAQATTLARERAANGHPGLYRIGFLGIGNESWDCGGNMTPDYYLSQLKIYSRFVRNFNPAQQDKQQMLKIAVGPGGGEPRWTEWTEAIMKAYQHHTWSWDTLPRSEDG